MFLPDFVQHKPKALQIHPNAKKSEEFPSVNTEQYFSTFAQCNKNIPLELFFSIHMTCLQIVWVILRLWLANCWFCSERWLWWCGCTAGSVHHPSREECFLQSNWGFKRSITEPHLLENLLSLLDINFNSTFLVSIHFFITSHNVTWKCFVST